MKARIITSEYWHKGMIGRLVETSEPDSNGDVYVIAPGTDLHRNGLWVKDYERVVETEDKIVEHEGVKYKVPGWATYLTRDDAADDVFYFEHKPVWYQSVGWAHPAGSDGRFGGAEVYIEPKPEGNFIKEI